MARILLGILIDLHLPDNQNSSRLLRVVRAVLDFLYLAQYPVHTSDTLMELANALDQFHENKNVFIDLGVRDGFNIPKIHFLRHYCEKIKLFGTTDNYNTQATERLHIDYAKEAYRASNTKDEYPQMTLWLEQKEKIHAHASYVSWRQADNPAATESWQDATLNLSRCAKMPKHPSVMSVSLKTLATDYGAIYIREALARFIVTLNHPNWTRRQVEDAALDTFLPFRTLSVFHKMKFITKNHGNPFVVDSVHVQPA